MGNKAFQKFIDRTQKGAHKKEQIRQEKKHDRQLKNDYFAAKKSRSGNRNRRSEQQSSFENFVEPSREDQRLRRGSTGNGRLVPSGDLRPEGKRMRNNRGATSQPFTPKQPEARKRKTTPHEVSVGHSKTAQVSLMPLNKFISHAGVCSRREAAELVKQGKVKVNGELIREPGHKVSEKDEVKLNGKRLSPKRQHVYLLLNKPKDCITTLKDPQGRATVMDIIKKATEERVYPVGRLDRNTTGVLLLTNDGDLAQKLSHPSFEVRKIYEVRLDRPLDKRDFEKILKGVELEDGFIAPDALSYADAKDKSVIGIEIHSGRNRVVRRIFEKLGYDVRNLDRVMYANLTKKNIERGRWRMLSEKEVRLLKYLNRSFLRKPPQSSAL